MIISRTPYRVSFFGGGTDYPEWFRNEGGAVLSTTIDKYCYISCQRLLPSFDFTHRVIWSHMESVSSISEILHPAVREGLRMMGFDDSVGLDIHHQGDLPARGGIGSSSSFSVGLINSLTALRGASIDKQQLARKAMELEQEWLKETVGCQDQMAAAYGGLNAIRFATDGKISVEPVAVTPGRLAEFQANLMLFFSGASRLSSEVAGTVVQNIPQRRDQLHRIREMVDEGITILTGRGPLDSIGELLHEAWMTKRELSPAVTSQRVDDIYERARAAGALGGKLLGAGGTGFAMFYVPAERQRAVADALGDCQLTPFGFESEGSTIIYRTKGGLLPLEPR